MGILKKINDLKVQFVQVDNDDVYKDLECSFAHFGQPEMGDFVIRNSELSFVKEVINFFEGDVLKFYEELLPILEENDYVIIFCY